MTNGEKMQEVFPEGKTRKCIGGVVFESDGWCHAYHSDWWNAEYKEPTKHEVKYCDRNICLKNEYNNVGCEDCEVTKSQEPTTKNDSEVEEHKGEVMDFPNTFDEFANEYGFKDKEEVYTNGSELIQVYRVKQWLEHINEKTTMIDKSNFSQEQYKADLQSAYDCGYNQACKSKITMPYATPDNCGNYIEQTPMSDLGVDCISRAEAIKCLECDFDITGEENMKTVVNYINSVHDKIVNLPRVKQEPIKPMVEIDLYSVIKQKYIEREVLDKIRVEMKPYTDPKGFIVIGENRFNMILDRCKGESEDT